MMTDTTFKEDIKLDEKIKKETEFKDQHKDVLALIKGALDFGSRPDDDDDEDEDESSSDDSGWSS